MRVPRPTDRASEEGHLVDTVLTKSSGYDRDKGQGGRS